MTLVIAGHNLEKKLSFGVAWSCLDNEDGTIESQEMKPNGLFVVSDSVITILDDQDRRVPIIGGFRKVYPVSIKIWKPYFIGSYFHSYKSVFFESECFIAIAGSTLVAQHVLNMISEHLGKLRISYERSNTEKQGKYVIIRHCQRNILDVGQGVDAWDECMFTANDYNGIVNAENISEIIEYSINEALSSARKYRRNEGALANMYTDFIAGIHCPTTNVHRLYTFRMGSRTNGEGLLEVYTTRQEIFENELAVVGMRTEFESRAQDVLTEAIRVGISPAKELFSFLNEAIDETLESGSYLIDRPSILKLFHQGQLTKTEFKPKANF